VAISINGDNSYGEIDHAQCDSQGHYTFSPVYCNKKYIVTAKAKGYGTVSSDETEAGTASTVTVHPIVIPVANSFVGGSVVDSKGNPVAGATVYDNSVDGLTATTDQAGHFMLNGTPAGKNSLWIQTTDGGYGNGDAQSGRGDNVIYVHMPGDPN
jgi:hypothetical protein